MSPKRTRKLLTVALVLVSCFLAEVRGSCYPGSSGVPKFDAYAVALHLQRCTGRPAFFTYHSTNAHPLAGDTLPPCDKDSLAAWLAPRGLKVFWEDSVLLIDYSDRYSHHETLYSWTKLMLEITVRNTNRYEIASREPHNLDNYKFVAVRRALSDEELKHAEDWILHNVPMPMVDSPTLETACFACPSVPRDTAFLKLEIRLEAVKLSKEGPERIVALLSSRATSRIVVGTLKQGEFRVDWISPLLSPERQVLLYRDVNSDGVCEIWSLSIYAGASELPWELVIFDLSGKELTRAAGDCTWPLSALQATSAKDSPLPTVCPIVGLPAVDHFLEEDGTVSLEAYRDFRGSEQEPRRYKFVAGRYILTKPSSRVQGPNTNSRELYEQAMQMFRQKKFEAAAAEFIKAADLDPANSQIANDIGFTYYKLENFEQSVAWFNRAIELDPMRAIAYLNLGDALSRQHRNAEARHAYTKYLDLAPDSKSAPDVERKRAALPPNP